MEEAIGCGEEAAEARGCGGGGRRRRRWEEAAAAGSEMWRRGELGGDVRVREIFLLLPDQVAAQLIG